MSHQLPPDVDLGDRLRASIDSGDLPALDLADVDRRAGRRARRRTVGTAVVAGTSALAFVGVLVVAVPAINEVTGGRAAPSASGAIADQAADPSGDLTDASLWPTLPPVKDSPVLYLTPAQVASAVGSGTWDQAAADMADPWTTRECSPSPLRDASEAEAGLGPRPSSSHVEPWAARRSQPAPEPAPGEPLPLPYEAFASLAALRWDASTDGAGRQWQQTIAKEAAGCPGAVRLSPGAVIGSMPVTVIAQPPTTDPGTVSDGTWSAMAVVAGGPTAVQVRYSGAPNARAAGDAALALLREGVAAVTAGDRAAAQVDDGARSGGVQAGRLAGFTDTQRWQSLPALPRSGPPDVALVSAEDPKVAFAGTRSWQSQPIAGTGVDWQRSWCTPDRLVGIATPDLARAREGGAPADESTSIWIGRSGPSQRPRADVDVLRWHPRDLADEPNSGPAGVDDIALSTADAWGAATAEDAVACPGAATLDPAGLPGAHATLTAVRDGDRWKVQAVSVGGPTGVRIRATVTADDAAAAGDQAVALARRVIANTVRADDVALGRTDPGPLP